jgi:hypothetical protein
MTDDEAIGRAVAAYGLSQGDNFTKHPHQELSSLWV